MHRDYLLRRHEEEHLKAANATSEAARIAHEGLAKAFKEAAERLGTQQDNAAQSATSENYASG